MVELFCKVEAQRNKKVTGAGFEPAPPKRKELESSALDHSAILSHGRIAQSVERRSDKAKALGSSPSVTTFVTFVHANGRTDGLVPMTKQDTRHDQTCASLAQSVERKTLNLVVVGSSPTGGAFLLLQPELHYGRRKSDEGGVRTHASEEIAALTQRLRPLGHLATWVCLRRRPVVRISGFHPGDPGSNPGGEAFVCATTKSPAAGIEPATSSSVARCSSIEPRGRVKHSCSAIV